MPKNRYKIPVIFLLCCIYWFPVLSSGENTIPLIIWWYETIFPHIEEDGKKLYEIDCGQGAKCHATRDRTMVNVARFQTIVYYGSDFVPDDVPLPREDYQMWALLHEESPQNNYILCQEDLLELFNFSSTFKQHSDFPLTTQYIPSIEYFHERSPVPIERKNKYRLEGLAPVVFIQSHCDVPSDRDRYVTELMKYMKIDSYGECLRNKNFSEEDMEGMESLHSENLLNLLLKYKFHLAFENALCDDYITEKIYRAFHVGSVPVYMGASSIDEWTPKKSVIKVTDYSSPKKLAEYLSQLDDKDDLYLQYLQYKTDKDMLPDKLKNVIETRSWSTTDPLLPHFVSEFERYVCREMHKIMQKKLSGEGMKPRLVKTSHLDCPQPKPSLGDLSGLSKSDGLHGWVEDYEQAKYQAKALADLIRNKQSDPARVWDYVADRMMRELHHSEL